MKGSQLVFRGGFAALVAAGAAAATLSWPDPAVAAKSDGCAGGGYTVSGFRNGATVGAQGVTTVAAGQVGNRLRVRGRYVEFDIVPASFAVRNYAFTGATNPEDITGGFRTPVFQSKVPYHRGLALTGAVSIDIDEDVIEITRTGPGLSMKIQAKDCAQGGIFQMEPERGDGRRTLVVHTLDPSAFYFDNPRFRAREGDVVPYKDTTIVVPSRINIANNVSPRFVTRDSSQVAERLDDPSCTNRIQTRLGAEDVLHCGRVSRWSVASGGRMGFVTGGDATEVAPPATDCIQNCQAQNRVRGRAVNLGFPFPVPARVRLQPDTPS